MGSALASAFPQSRESARASIVQPTPQQELLILQITSIEVRQSRDVDTTQLARGYLERFDFTSYMRSTRCLI
jgi:hypothetical protein